MEVIKQTHHFIYLIIAVVVSVADAKVEISTGLSSLGNTYESNSVETDDIEVQAVRKDGLSYETIFLVNSYYTKYGLLRNPLKESVARKLMDEIFAAQKYYFRNGGGVDSIPQELKEWGRKANSLYQNTANERYPATEPNKLSPTEKKEICENFPNGLRDFYLDLCIK